MKITTCTQETTPIDELVTVHILENKHFNKYKYVKMITNRKIDIRLVVWFIMVESSHQGRFSCSVWVLIFTNASS